MVAAVDTVAWEGATAGMNSQENHRKVKDQACYWLDKQGPVPQLGK